MSSISAHISPRHAQTPTYLMVLVDGDDSMGPFLSAGNTSDVYSNDSTECVCGRLFIIYIHVCTEVRSAVHTTALDKAIRVQRTLP